MAAPISSSHLLHIHDKTQKLSSSSSSSSSTIQILILALLLLTHQASSVSFNLSSFPSNSNSIHLQGDAFVSENMLQITKGLQGSSLLSSTGRASYSNPIRLWNSGQLADFTTHFSFIINAFNASKYGDGLSFFIAPFDSDVPPSSAGGYLALFSNDTAKNSSKNPIVAVEFDSFKNDWDPSENHVGINVNSIVSVANVTWNSSIKDGRMANAWIGYNSSTKNLTVFLSYAKNPVFSGNSSLHYVVDLRDVLPELVRIGFSASTGQWTELHQIISWTFESNLETDPPEKSNLGVLVGGSVAGFVVVASVLGFVGFLIWRKRGYGNCNNCSNGSSVDGSMDDEFETGAGPRRFTYRDLSRATGGFAESGKLGEGGFGGVYKGLLTDPETHVAVKRVSKGSKQGKKEYISEVKIISRLRHRNLVQLVGWCHERGEFLLVYELMPNGSLDSYLFGVRSSLPWATRHRISLGLASCLLYLHEEWEQCVVHRDIKSSNIMLDSSFNAKLGDFGLARFVDHELGSQTTVLAGTMGYMAPECVTTGKASKESDVYSFGVVCLEIACGRRPVDPRAEPGRVRLVEWVWDMYGQGQLLEAVDRRLDFEFDENEVVCLMVVGLWCCHPDLNLRPSIRQAINVMKSEAPLPSLPAKLPVPMYYAPPLQMCKLMLHDSNGFTTDRTQCSCSNCSTMTSSNGSSKALISSNRVRT